MAFPILFIVLILGLVPLGKGASPQDISEICERILNSEDYAKARGISPEQRELLEVAPRTALAHVSAAAGFSGSQHSGYSQGNVPRRCSSIFSKPRNRSEKRQKRTQ